MRKTDLSRHCECIFRQEYREIKLIIIKIENRLKLQFSYILRNERKTFDVFPLQNLYLHRSGILHSLKLRTHAKKEDLPVDDWIM